MTKISLPWKNFKVHLPSLHSWLKENFPAYDGMECGAALTLEFKQIIESFEYDEITSYWASIDEINEASKYFQDDIKKSQRGLKLYLEIFEEIKSWKNQEYSSAGYTFVTQFEAALAKEEFSRSLYLFINEIEPRNIFSQSRNGYIKVKIREFLAQNGWSAEAINNIEGL